MNEFITLRKQIMEKDFARMNDMQRQAVFSTEGPLLILAGAGSGKTTVLVNRIACLVKYGRAYDSQELPTELTDGELDVLRSAAEGKSDTGQAALLCAVEPCPAWRILAITFTNKAAGELRERLERILCGQDGRDVQASTFHAFCARILRRDGELLGFSRHFTIYDTDDSRRLMKACMKALNVDEKVLGHKAILAEISRAKDRLTNPKEFSEQAGRDFRLRQAAQCYELYQKRLHEADAMDFDDLLFMTVRLFHEHSDVLERYQHRFRYVMVDEYQDTNRAQYELVSMLAAKSGNLCVVGDDDQSIYKFRGATIENILSFEKQFKGCRVIRLEQNYRSTKTILAAANAVISRNIGRKEKSLWTENPEGDKIQLHTLPDEASEGRFIADTVMNGIAGGMKYSEFAILYRANAQSNAIEQALVKSGIPYRIIGGHRFFDTQEIRDAMAYLRIINNPGDEVSLRRIINQPRRGIGASTIDSAAEIAMSLGLSLYEVISHADQYTSLSRAAAKLRLFTDMIDRLRTMDGDPEVSPHLLYTAMLEVTGYLEMWKLKGDEEIGRVENLNELASSIIEYEKNSPSAEETGGLPELAGFLEEAALMTDVDNYDAETDSVVLMTMHAAKGLEFPVVILPGFEDGIFPGFQTMFDPDELEEDRRLCYVAITRAKQQLYILSAQSRMLYGSTTRNRPSRFLADIPAELTTVRRQSAPVTGFTQSTPRVQDSVRTETVRRGTAPVLSYTGKSAVSNPARKLSSASSVASAPKPQGSAANAQWKPGNNVVHKVFGQGSVLGITPTGNDYLLEINFDKVGVKKIMANYAQLTRGDT